MDKNCLCTILKKKKKMIETNLYSFPIKGIYVQLQGLKIWLLIMQSVI